MTRTTLSLPGAEASLDSAWLDGPTAEALFARLQATIPWEVHRIRLFGRLVDSPRLSCWIGDPGAAYTYSGTRFVPRPWPRALDAVRARLRDTLGVDFNSVLANLYRDGRDGMGWHRDSEAELGPDPLIASLSLGATRRFAFRGRRDPRDATRRLVVPLPAGSLLVMGSGVQRHYQHALPKTARQVGPRINLTFRRVLQLSDGTRASAHQADSAA